MSRLQERDLRNFVRNNIRPLNFNRRNYEIGTELGGGAQGKVYVAREKAGDTEEKYAMKISTFRFYTRTDDQR